MVFPSLILNYAGQSAIVLEGASTADNIFYRLCPEPLLIPFVALATLATIIASQSIITGAFSMTRQAIQLGWLPRAMTAAGGLGHTLPYLIPDFFVATIVSVCVVAAELAIISFIRHRFMDTPFLAATFQVVVGGVLVFIAGIAIGSA